MSRPQPIRLIDRGGRIYASLDDLELHFSRSARQDTAIEAERLILEQCAENMRKLNG